MHDHTRLIDPLRLRSDHIKDLEWAGIYGDCRSWDINFADEYLIKDCPYLISFRVDHFPRSRLFAAVGDIIFHSNGDAAGSNHLHLEPLQDIDK